MLVVDVYRALSDSFGKELLPQKNEKRKARGI
jgi:hypothetical protein